MWILIWVVLSAILLGATLWSLQILLRQKKAWEAYARKKGLAFNKGTFMGNAEINGQIGNYKVAFFSAERQESDIRRKRFVTGIEFTLFEAIIDGGVAGTQEMLAFMQSLTKLHPYNVEGWEQGHYLFVRTDAVAKAYFTPDRLNVCADILKTRNADVVLAFGVDQVILRVETADPMQDAEKIDKITTRLISLMDKLRIDDAERQALAKLAKPQSADS
jgi:hypothetical protein